MHREQLMRISPLIPLARADAFAGPLTQAMADFGIDTPEQQAQFMAQALQESGYLQRLVENLNYSPAGLRATFGNRFTEAQAEQYGRTPAHPANQRQIAVIAYGGRLGNRPGTEDGWLCRGRGIFQLTGRDNYTACGEALGLDLLDDPALLEGPDVACQSAGWFWTANGLNKMDDVRSITRKINGPAMLGLAERTNFYERALAVLA
jgi:putative chitinase